MGVRNEGSGVGRRWREEDIKKSATICRKTVEGRLAGDERRKVERGLVITHPYLRGGGRGEPKSSSGGDALNCASEN